MNNNDTKIVLIFMAVFILISIMSLFYFSADLSLAASSREIEQAQSELSGLRASNMSSFTGFTTRVSKSLSYAPMIIVLIAVIAACIWMYTNILKVNKKGHVSFVKNRDIKKIAPDLYAKKKGLERAQKALLQNRVSELENENLWHANPVLAKISNGHSSVGGFEPDGNEEF